MDRGFNPRDTCQKESGQLKKKKGAATHTRFINLSKNPVCAALFCYNNLARNIDRNQGFNPGDTCQEQSGPLFNPRDRNQVLCGNT